MSARFRLWAEKNSAPFSGEIRWDEPLSKHTYYRIGGPAAALAIPRSLADLEWLASGIQATQIPFFILGLGSNLLVSDEGFAGLVVKATRLNLEITHHAIDPNRIVTGGSVALSTLLRRATQEGWAGLEFLTGIPGSVGGAIAMNAGTHLGETSDRVKRVVAMNLHESLEKLEFIAGQMPFKYRKNFFLPDGAVVYEVEWEVNRVNPLDVKAKIDETLQRRKATQPIDFPSCGSVFKNPRESGLSAWQVIDQLGLRGHRAGGAQFSEKHSNFIINHGTAQAAEVRSLIELAKKLALEKLGIRLEEEVKYLGKF